MHGRIRIRLVIASLAVTALVASVAATSVSAKRTAVSNGLMDPTTLVVGMDLQFKPQMYLQNGKPAGYDVVLLKALAKQLGVKLKIENLDFNGLIPGLQSKKFDMVSVGLSPTPEREKVISFSRAYVPYAQILAAKKGDTTPATIAAWNSSDKTITSLQGSTAEQLVQKTVPERKGRVVPRPERGVPARSRPAARTASWSRTTCSHSSTSRTATRSCRSASRSRCRCSTAPTRCRRATWRSCRR